MKAGKSTKILEKLTEIVFNGIVNPEGYSLCESYFEPVFYRRNTVIEQEQKIPQFLYFVSSGYLRLFYINETGDEVTTHLTGPCGFIASYLSLVKHTPANESLACITDCWLLRISRASLICLIDKNPIFQRFSLTIFEEALASGQKRANELATFDADARYQLLAKEQPGLLQNVPVQYIASYLGIKPQSLSRIRRRRIS